MTIEKRARRLVECKLAWDAASYQYFKFESDQADEEIYDNFILSAESYRTALEVLIHEVLKSQRH